MTEDIWVKGYVYSVEVAEESGRYRGCIHVKAHRYTGRTFEPPIVIETPALFKREHAAEIEARALARELIDGGRLEEHIASHRHDAPVPPVPPISPISPVSPVSPVPAAQPFSDTSSHTE
ncbi:hypothetical protein OU994_30615 [Pseudoduganella sp. SL102]|uniref:hypothetical protein n=1 Tax=Pseudoduganella sp. SL102 TaxID=2995154 RepID=UPI00248C4B54|nr:hypothetical protein [Pseudoduganella sp. SL102]WBS02543.1 hypothetical protein OU994_30615 [Pseudoduganella sp. SL102]